MTVLLNRFVDGLYLALLVSGCFVGRTLYADEPTEAAREDLRSAASQTLSLEAQEIADHLDKILPEGSEARAMYDTILSGAPLGPDSGWWRVAKSQTRFDWAAVQQRFDADHDGRVTRREFPGSAIDFRNLDEDGDNVLSEADLQQTQQALEKTPGFHLFLEADEDVDGKVTRREFDELFDRWDEGKLGFLAPSDLRDRLPESDAQRGVQQEDEKEPSPKRSRGPSTETLLQGLARQEIGSLQPGPSVGEKAPDFTLPEIDGGEPVRLLDKVGEKPVVLVFGNFTCSPFRRQSGNIQKLHSRYHDRAEFLMVYVREAHPTDGWSSANNDRHDIRIAQPQNDAQRRQVAARCAAHLELPFPLLVDHVDDRVGARYSGMPNRLYLIDENGVIVFKSGRGPFGFRPRELEQALLLLLNGAAG